MNAAAHPVFVERVAAYLAHWRALGRQYHQQEWLLHRVLDDLQAMGHDDLTASSFTAWFDSRRHLHPNTRRNCAQMLRHFCVHRRRTDPGCFVPPRELACSARPHVTPVILGEQQVAFMLEAAAALEPSPNSPLRPAAMRMAVALLYTTGLRLGELQRLVLSDVEDNGAILRVRESKFHKSRLLPLSASTQAELLAYLDRRALAGFRTGPAAPLLCTRARGSTSEHEEILCCCQQLQGPTARAQHALFLVLFNLIANDATYHCANGRARRASACEHCSCHAANSGSDCRVFAHTGAASREKNCQQSGGQRQARK